MLIIMFQHVKMWGEQDSNLRRRKPAELQSAPVGHFGISPNIFNKYKIVREECGFGVCRRSYPEYSGPQLATLVSPLK